MKKKNVKNVPICGKTLLRVAIRQQQLQHANMTVDDAGVQWQPLLHCAGRGKRGEFLPKKKNILLLNFHFSKKKIQKNKNINST